jgi:hypothetical protein
MENERIGAEEFKTAVGNVRAELYMVLDEFRHDRISRDAYVQRVRTLRQAGQRFHREYKQQHVIMAAPLRASK